MTLRGKKRPAAAEPVVGELVESPAGPDGTRRHKFTVDGVDIQIRAIDADSDDAAASIAGRLHALSPLLVAPPPRETEWGDGQFDRTQLGPGVAAALKITRDGRVRMLIPGGELDVTDGAVSLGTGLHEASARAAQIRVRLEEMALRKRERADRGEGSRVAHLPRRSPR